MWFQRKLYNSSVPHLAPSGLRLLFFHIFPFFSWDGLNIGQTFLIVVTSAVTVKVYVSFSNWASARECPGYGSSTLCAVKVLEQSLAWFWTWQAGSLPDRAGHGSGHSTGQGPFPVDNLDAAPLLWRARKCNSIDVGLLPFASGPENSYDHIWITRIDKARGPLYLSCIMNPSVLWQRCTKRPR